MIRFLLLTLITTTVLGCQSVPPPVNARNDPYIPEQVNLTETALRVRTAFTQPTITRHPRTELLHVQVPVRATTDQQLYVEYRTVWLDANGQAINPNPAWQAATLAPNVWTNLTAQAFTQRAADFRMDVRFGRIN